MQWDEAARLFSLIDLTSLNENDTEESIAFLCEKAQSSFGHVASVCVYPKFVRQVADQFENTPIKTTTVANFPLGLSPLDEVLVEIGAALEAGAQEIDVVFPYTRYLAGERESACHFVETCKAACGENVILKVILETGALSDLAIISSASFDALRSGADFIKTSTGKMAQGATLEAADAMLQVIRKAELQLRRKMGIKISGGVREIQQAVQYIQLADKVMGREWVTPDTFRIGASKLVDELRKVVA